jgi:hypothetical protein
MKQLLALSMVLAAAAQAQWHQVFIPIADKAELSQVIETLGGLDPCGTTFSEAGIELPVEAAEYQRLASAGLRPQMLISDLETFYAGRIGTSRNYGAYHTFSEGMAVIQQLHADYPSIVGEPVVIGNSLQGNPIWAVKISDNPEVDEDEPEVFYNAYIHAREAITIEVLLHFMQHLTSNYGSDERVTQIVNERELWFVPFINPDGVLYNESTNPAGGGMWRKNRSNNGDGSRGVDLNRNFGYQWGFDNSGSSPTPSSETYRGPSAFSEPESQVIRDFVNSREFTSAITYHSYSNLYIYPWGYDEIYTPAADHACFVELCGQMASHNGYAPGTAWELLYSTNGSTDDWFYGDQSVRERIFAITPEVGTGGDGFWPAESRIPQLVAENLEPNLLFAERAGNPWGVLPPAMPVLNPIGAVGADYLVSWSTPGPDPANPAVAYELRELSGLTVGSDPFNDADNWEGGASAFALSNARAVSPPTSFYGGTGNNRNAFSVLGQALLVQPGDAITFQAWYDIENNWDYAYVEVSANGGGSWQGLPGNLTTTTNPNGNNEGHGITGSSGGWVAGVFPLDAWVGQSLLVRLRYRTDGWVLGEGFYVDDFAPVSAFAGEVVLDSGIVGESYAISGQAPGEYWYQVRAVDAEGDWSAWSAAEEAISSGGPDLTPPLIVHAGLPDTGDNTGPWTVTVELIDPSGIAAASLEHRINGGAWQAQSMLPLRETWSAQIPGPAAYGSQIEYRITASDASENGNTGQSPIYSFLILVPAGLEYCQDFENGLDDFSVETYIPGGNSWTAGSYSGQGGTAYISYSSQGQQDHSGLLSPVFDCSQQATVELSFWHYLRMGYSGAWTDAYLRGSVDGGVTWPYLLGEWHEDDQPGDFVVTGDETLDLSSWAAGQSQVRLLFEYHDLYDWYWHVDEVCLTGTLALQPDPVVLSIAVSGQDAQLSWAGVPFAIAYDIHAGPQPYGELPLVATVASPGWTDFGAAALAQRSYRVVARSAVALDQPDVPQLDAAANRQPAPPLEKSID